MNTPDISRAMKRLVGVALASALMAVPCTAVAAEAGVPLDAAHFPDAAFREVIKQYDTDGNGVFSQQELADVTSIDGSCYTENNEPVCPVASVEGIEYFTALEYLGMYGNQLKSVDLSKSPTLTGINLGNNQLTSIDLGHNTALTELDLGGNQLSSVDVSHNTALTYLGLWGNQLSSVDVSRNTALERLDLWNNQLASVDVSRNTALTELDLGGNQLASVDVSHNTAIERLGLSDNQLSSVDVSRNTALDYLRLDDNELLWLSDVAPSAKDSFTADDQLFWASGSTLDLAEAAPGIDVSRISNVQGGALQGTVLTPTSNDGRVTYDYRFSDAFEPLRAQVQFEADVYTVAFDANGGSGNTVISVVSGDTVTAPEPPTRDGYIFDGWYTAKDGGTKFDFTKPITADVTLYAHWVAQEIPAITFRDVSSLTPHHEDIQWLADNGISTGWKTADGKYEFRGMSAVVRQDMAAFLRREAKNRGVDDAADWKPTDADWKRFRDVNRGTPHAEDILWLAHAGISTGWKEADGSCTFRGMDTVKRQDMAAFLKRLADKAGKANGVKPKTDFTDVSDRTPHAAEVRWLGGSGISTGYRNADGTWRFEGMTSVYRQDMAAFLHRLDNQLGK